MVNPVWYLTAWALVAVASAWKFWRLTGGYRRSLSKNQKINQSDLTLFRSNLEESWQRNKTEDPI